nr:RNA-directed DNA polymerase, eukaryota, reverse transcriptase zinc-binding domain protein [Tanacetum cinerariifolium]
MNGALYLLRYLKETISKGLFYPVQSQLKITGFSDVDWANCLMTRRSLTGYCIFVGHSQVSWKTKKQPTGLWNVCVNYGRLVDSFIANKRSKGGKRFGFIRFLRVKDESKFLKHLSNIWIGSYHLYVTNARFQRHNTTGMKVPKPVPHHDTDPKAKPNPNHQHVDQVQSKPSFASIIYNKPASPITKTVSLKDHALIRVDDSLTVLLLKIKDVDTMSNMPMICKNEDESTAMSSGRVCISTKSHSMISETINVEIHGESFVVSVHELGTWSTSILDNSLDSSSYGDNNDNDKVKENFAVDLNDLNDNLNNLVQELNEEEVKATKLSDEDQVIVEEEVKIVNPPIPSTVDISSKFARGRSGGLISMWDTNMFKKERIWCDEAYIIMKGQWSNAVVDCFMINIYAPQESTTKSTLWNKLTDFMQHHNGKYILLGLLDLHIGGRLFTWMNKAGTKMSKLDCFLIFEDILKAIPDICITALDKLWSDHTPILLYVSKSDFGPTLFKFYNSWLLHDGFDECIKAAWPSLEFNSDDRRLASHEKLRSLKHIIKQWHANLSSHDHSSKQTVMRALKLIDKKIDNGSASQTDLDNRIKLMQDLEIFYKFEGLDLVTFSPLLAFNTLPDHDRISLEAPASIVEIKDAVWACGSSKATGPDGLFDAPWFQFFFFTLIPKIVSHEQSAFIMGHQILDGPLILSEAIDWFKKRKKKMLIFKVDFEKAFDSVSWKYLDFVLHSLGFDNIIRVFPVFYLASGLKINMHKSNIYGVGVSNEDVSSMAKDLCCASGSFPLMYLGLLIGSNMSLINNWKPLTDCFHSRLSYWKANLLSIGVRCPMVSILLFHVNSKDGPLILSEAIDWFKKRKKKMLIFKVDFEKAFDSVSWKYLDFVLHSLGFASGLKINMHKSNIYGVGVSNEDVSSMAKDLCCASGSFPLMYLGLLIGYNMSLINNWKPLTDWFHSRLSYWKANLLSIGAVALAFAFEKKFGTEILLFVSRVRNSASLIDLIYDIDDVDLNMEEDSCMWALSYDGSFSIGDTRCLIDAKLLPSSTTPTSWDKVLSRGVVNVDDGEDGATIRGGDDGCVRKWLQK